MGNDQMTGKTWISMAGLIAVTLGAATVLAQAPAGVLPRDARNCPDEQPVKGYASRHGESRGVFYEPGHAQYERIRPERCFASAAEATEAGYRSGRDERPASRQGRERR